MDVEAFENGLARDGAALSAWPEASREAAKALLAGSARARRARDEMAALDEAILIAREAPPPASAALLERVMADAADVAMSAAAAPRRRRLSLAARLGGAARALSFPMLRPAVACAASAAVGLWLGQSAMMAGAAETLIDGDAGAAQEFALDGGDPLEGAEYAFLPEGDNW